MNPIWIANLTWQHFFLQAVVWEATLASQESPNCLSHSHPLLATFLGSLLMVLQICLALLAHGLVNLSCLLGKVIWGEKIRKLFFTYILWSGPDSTHTLHSGARQAGLELLAGVREREPPLAVQVRGTDRTVLSGTRTWCLWRLPRPPEVPGDHPRTMRRRLLSYILSPSLQIWTIK